MKWKITSRYLASVLSIFIIVFIVNTIIFLILLAKQSDEGNAIFNMDYGVGFARSFSDELAVEDGGITLSEQGWEKLKESGAWIEVLDEGGTVIETFLAPANHHTHYSPLELVHYYKYMDDDFNTYFVGGFDQYSYLVIHPSLDAMRHVWLVNDVKIIGNIALFLVLAFFVNLIISAVVGFIFSLFFTKPVNRMIERIQTLKNRVFKKEVADEKGLYKQVFANLNDVAETLHQFENERQKLEIMRNEWISNVSHDIKTPLSSIRGYAELLQNKDVTDDERMEYAEVVERHSLYIRELLDDFNLTLRLRNKEMALKLEETNMEHFVRELIIDLLNDPQFSSEDIEYIHETAHLVWIIDRHLMKRALLNFIYNAFIHNEHVNVKVIITTESIIIEDDGKGISPSEQEQVFTRYYRGTNTTDIKGTGLGMAISRDIIIAHGGDVQLTSERNKGTKIEIKL